MFPNCHSSAIDSVRRQPACRVRFCAEMEVNGYNTPCADLAFGIGPHTDIDPAMLDEAPIERLSSPWVELVFFSV